MSKITMQDIADSLQISRISVWKVFNRPGEVSDALRIKVAARAKEMGYISNSANSAMLEQTKTISIIVSRPESSLFWTEIIHQIAQELSKTQTNLMYTYVPPITSGAFQVPKTLLDGSVDGAVILNVYDYCLLKRINELPLPKVFLDTVPELAPFRLSGDLLLIEGTRAIYEITQSLIQKNISDIGFIGDIHYAQTNLDRYSGFLNCMKEHHLPVRTEACLTHCIDIYSYSREIHEYLDQLENIPEAFVCASDFIAHFVKEYFSERPERLPERFYLTGFDGSREYANVADQITTARVQTGSLGIRLVRQISYRMEYPDAPCEFVYVQPEVHHKESIITLNSNH